MAGRKVELYVYDLSNGLARLFSLQILGKQIDAVYHTSIALDGREHYFGGGVQVGPAGGTPFGRPVEVIQLGETQLPAEVVADYVAELASGPYTAESYDLLHHNCNDFSNDLATFLTGKGIPPHITGLPAEVMATDFGRSLLPMLGVVQSHLGSVRQPAPGQAAEPSPALSQPLVPPAALAGFTGAPAAAAPSSGSSAAPAGGPPGGLLERRTSLEIAEAVSEVAHQRAGGSSADGISGSGGGGSGSARAPQGIPGNSPPGAASTAAGPPPTAGAQDESAAARVKAADAALARAKATAEEKQNQNGSSATVEKHQQQQQQQQWQGGAAQQSAAVQKGKQQAGAGALQNGAAAAGVPPGGKAAAGTAPEPGSGSKVDVSQKAVEGMITEEFMRIMGSGAGLTSSQAAAQALQTVRDRISAGQS